MPGLRRPPVAVRVAVVKLQISNKSRQQPLTNNKTEVFEIQKSTSKEQAVCVNVLIVSFEKLCTKALPYEAFAICIARRGLS